MAYREWREQQRLCLLLSTWLPDDAFWTAIDTVARSATAGAMRKRRGVKAGLCDVLIWYRGRTYCIELKGPYGQCRPAQRVVREQMLRAGVSGFWFCRTAESVLAVLVDNGVKLRTLTNADGSIESWRRPKLEDWEIPKSDSREKRPPPPHYWTPKLPAETPTSEPTVAADDAPADLAA
jgi:hypothetical protein